MMEKKDTSVSRTETEYFYNDTDTVSARMGFNLAFGITKFDGDSKSIEDPTIGTVKAYYKKWGGKDDGDGIVLEPIPTRRCTYADFGLDEEGNHIEK
jgi:hypothetical protein